MNGSMQKFSPELATQLSSGPLSNLCLLLKKEVWCECGIHYLGVSLVGGAFVPEGPSKKLAPMCYTPLKEKTKPCHYTVITA